MRQPSSITVLGLGTLGGFVASEVSQLRSVDHLTVVDYDKVSEKNLRNSIYLPEDTGKLKIVGISKFINPKTELIQLNEKFIEGVTKLPESDIILDCRDFIHNRKDGIDSRLSISNMSLMVDCRKNIEYDIQYEGMYNRPVERHTLKLAATNMASMISSGMLNELITNQIFHRVNLDPDRDAYKAIDKNKNKPEYDLIDNPFNNHFLHLDENFETIRKMNMERDVKVCLGSKENPILCKTIGRGSLTDINAAIKELSGLLQTPTLQKHHYLVSPEENEWIIELIMETGAA